MPIERLIDIIMLSNEIKVDNLKNFIKRIWNETKNMKHIVYKSSIRYLYEEVYSSSIEDTSSMLISTSLNHDFKYKKLSTKDNIIFISMINIINRHKKGLCEDMCGCIYIGFENIKGNITPNEFNKILRKISSYKLISCNDCSILHSPGDTIHGNNYCEPCYYSIVGSCIRCHNITYRDQLIDDHCKECYFNDSTDTWSSSNNSDY